MLSPFPNMFAQTTNSVIACTDASGDDSRSRVCARLCGISYAAVINGSSECRIQVLRTRSSEDDSLARNFLSRFTGVRNSGSRAEGRAEGANPTSERVTARYLPRSRKGRRDGGVREKATKAERSPKDRTPRRSLGDTGRVGSRAPAANGRVVAL